MSRQLDDLTDHQLGSLVGHALHRSLDIDLHTDCAEPAGDGERQIGEAIRAAFRSDPDKWASMLPDDDEL